MKPIRIPHANRPQGWGIRLASGLTAVLPILAAAPRADALVHLQPAGADHLAFEAEVTSEIVVGTPENWGPVSDAQANAGAALQAGGTNSTGNSPHSFAQYDLRFATAGTYYLYYRWKADPARTAGDVFTANSAWIANAFGDFRTPGDQSTFVTSSVNDTSAPANNTYDWRREPDTLVYTASAGATVRFTVGTREAGMTFDRFVFSTRGDLTPVQLDALANADTDLVVQGAGQDYVAWEAEKKVALVAGTPENWTVTDIAEANQGRALIADGTNSTGNSPHSFAQYGIQFTTAGTYYLYYRWRADPARTAGDVFTANSYWIGNGFGDYRTPGDQTTFTTSSVNDTSAPANNTFDWRREPESFVYTVSAADLTAGPRIFSVGTREAGMTLDRFVLSTRSDLTPVQLDALVNSGEVASAPELRSATGSDTFNAVTVVFSRPLNPASVTAARFSLDGGLTVSAAAVDASDARIVRLTTTAQTPGTVYTLTVTGVTDTSGGTIAPGSTIPFSAWILANGWARKEIYFGIAGSTVFDLQSDPDYQARRADRVEYVRGFQLNQSPQTDNYGAHLEAFFVPSQSGAWDFFLYNDDEAELFLSSDTTAANLGSLGVFPLSPPAFDEAITSQSPSLTSGSRYLLVGQLKQGGGDVYLNVGARPAGSGSPAIADLPVLQGNLIATYVNPDLGQVTFDAQPQSVTARAGARAQFSVSVTPASENPVYYRWEVNGSPIPGATRRSYITPVLTTADSGRRYTCVVSVAGVDTRSAEATLTVLPGDPSNLQPYVGVNFVGGGGGGVGAALGATEAAGVVLQENWNNLTGFQFTDTPLRDASGNTSPVTLNIASATETWYSGTATVGDTDGALLQGLITFGSSTDPLDAIFSGVPSGTYNVYVYSVGFTFSPDYRQRVLLLGATTPPELKVIAETGLAYTTNPGWRRMRSTNPDARDTGNYVVFENVSPAGDGTFTVSLAWEGEGGNTHQPALNAIQIVRVLPQAPSSVVLGAPSIVGANLSLSWTGGVGPFGILRRDALGTGTWTEVTTTADRTAAVPITGAHGFIQIQDKGR